MHSILNVRLFVAALLLSVAALSTASAQDVSARDVTLIEVENATAHPAMVYRRVAGDDREIIALSPNATADDLSSALRVLAVLHARFGRVPDRDMAAAARSHHVPSHGGAQAEARRTRHGLIVSALKRSERRHVAGFGAVKVLRIKVPTRNSRSD